MANFTLRRVTGGSRLRDVDQVRAGAGGVSAGAGTATVTFTATGTGTTASAGASWTIDESLMARVAFTVTAAGSTNTPVAPPPAAVAASTAPIKRVSITMPPPALDALGRPT